MKSKTVEVYLCPMCVEDVALSSYSDVTVSKCGKCKRFGCEHDFRYGPEDGPICSECDGKSRE